MKRQEQSSRRLTRRRFLTSALHSSLAAFCAPLLLPGCSRRRAARPNILFILIDALRADYLGAYGSAAGHSPTLDSIAQTALVFDRAIAPAPWTQPSIASLFCSRYPGVHRVTDYDSAFEAVYAKQSAVTALSDSFTTLAEALQHSGYYTAAFVANPYIIPEFGFAQGFDHFDSSFANNATPGNVVNDAAVAWLKERNPARPFFCFLHYMDVHGPYDAPPQFLDPLLDRIDAMSDKRKLTAAEFKQLNYLRTLPPVHTDRPRHERLRDYLQYWTARYAAGIRQLDFYLADLRNRLAELRLWDSSYIIVTADHGESLCEHGYWDHGFTVYHPELRIPLLLRWPGSITPGRIPETVRLIDLMPTLIDQVGLPGIDDLQGVSLSSLITSRSPRRRPVGAFAEAIKIGPEQKALYIADFKLIITAGRLQPQLFNIAADPLEQNTITTQQPQKTQQLVELIQQQNGVNQRLGSRVVLQSVPLTPEQKNRLRSLGYLK